MSNREELDGLLFLMRTLSGESDVIEHMEAEGQERVVKNTMMAKKMRPSKEAWEQLGFVFTDIPADDVLCNATLPEGWSLRVTDHSMWNEIIDENGMIRGSMFYKAAFYDRDAHMSLQCRYAVRSSYVGDDYSTTEVYFGNENEKLFVAGQVHVSEDISREEKCARYNKIEELRAVAQKFGDENYPDWQNVHAYWGDEKEISRSRLKK